VVSKAQKTAMNINMQKLSVEATNEIATVTLGLILRSKREETFALLRISYKNLMKKIHFSAKTKNPGFTP
jgi:hypothetical protein